MNSNRPHTSDIETSLFRRFAIFGRTAWKVFLVGGTVYAVGLWHITGRLSRKLDDIYSKSSPHTLERYNHLYLIKGAKSGYEDEEEEDHDLKCYPQEQPWLNKFQFWKSEWWLNVFWPENDGDGQNMVSRFAGETTSLFPFFKIHKDDPSFLIKMVRSKNNIIWKYGIDALMTLSHAGWRDEDYWRVAQSLDPKSIIAISQYDNVDPRFFLPTKKTFSKKKGEVFTKLRTLLSNLPLESADLATKFFTEQALKLADDNLDDEEDLDELFEESFLGGDHLEYKEAVRHISMTPQEKQEFICLEALACHSKNKENCSKILKMPVLPLLLNLVYVQSAGEYDLMIAEIIGNIACCQESLESIALAGWVGLLVQWRQSLESSFTLKLAASRALINLFLNVTRGGRDSQVLKDGVYPYHPARSFFSSDFQADLVFIHGLLGGASFTWRQSLAGDEDIKTKSSPSIASLSYCWPKDWLSEDISQVRMIGVEYYTQLSEWESPHHFETKEDRTVVARANQLLARLEAAGIGNRPIVWITHSMGGLLVKEMLRIAAARDSNDDILANTCGVIFYAVPHKGSPLADLGTNLFYIAFPTIEVQELGSSNKPFLDNLNDFFSKLADKGISCLSFAELKPTLLGEYVSDRLSVHIVPPDSADPGYGQFIPVDADHMNICKPTSRDSYLYTMTVNFVKDCLEKRRIENALKVATSAIAADMEIGDSDTDSFHLNYFWE